MTISNTHASITRIQRELAELQKKVATEQSSEARLFGKLNQAQLALAKSTSTSTTSSKIREIERLQIDIAKCNERKADLGKKIAAKSADLHRYQNQLTREEASEQKKQDDLQKKREKEYLAHQKRLTQEFERQKKAMQAPTTTYSSAAPSPQPLVDVQYDVFISHASEDKDVFVRPFAQALIDRGIAVWYDEMSLRWGDSLRKNIDKGLANSRFGIVVLSKNFIQKQWTEYELNGLIASEVNGQGRVLPIWHEISKTEVMKYSPSLADKLAMNTLTQTVDEIVEELVSILK
ncbi:TIR domain-containing protein [Erwinia sp. PK3-005]